MKKIPLRKCLATSEQLPKKEMIRIVRDKENNVIIDESGRSNGRGAYLKKSVEAVEIAQKKHLLERALECSIPEDVYTNLKSMLIK